MPRRRASPKVEGKSGRSKLAQAASAAENYDGESDFPIDDLPPDDLRFGMSRRICGSRTERTTWRARLLIRTVLTPPTLIGQVFAVRRPHFCPRSTAKSGCDGSRTVRTR